MGQKIAVVTQDNVKISSHFGMSPYYQVFTVQDGQIVAQEQRDKPYHEHHRGHLHSRQTGSQVIQIEAGKAAPPAEDLQQHGGGGGHRAMFSPIADCQILLCGGMGQGAYQGAVAAGLEVVLAGGEIYPTVKAYLAGDISSDPRRVH